MKRPVPADFADYMNHETIAQLTVRYRASRSTVRKWCDATPIVRENMQGGLPPAALPADFAAVQVGKTVTELCAHYGRNKHVIQRWTMECGIVRKRMAPGRKAARVATVPARSVHPMTAPLDRVQRDVTPAGLAADDLRRDRWAVHRCDPNGRANPNGTHWVCGRVIVTDDELIERAERARRRMAA